MKINDKQIRFWALLALLISIIIGTSSCDKGKEDKQIEEKQQTASMRLSLNLKKGFNCEVEYDAQINISQKGQSDGTGDWNVKGTFLLNCNNVDKNGVMTITQSPLKISIKGTDIKDIIEIDFESSDKNQQIPNLVRGHLNSLIAIKSVRLDGNGKIIEARQSPDIQNYDFMATGKISYHPDTEWIIPDNSENEEKVKYILNSIVGIPQGLFEKEFTVGKTVTTKEEPRDENQVQAIYNWTLEDIHNHTAQLKTKGDIDNESKSINSEFVDEIEQFESTWDGLLEVDIETGLVMKFQCSVTTEHRTMTLIPSLDKRVPTFSNSSKINFTTEIIEQIK